MKRTGFCGLIVLALLMTLLSLVPAQASDHPWDGTNKVRDTTIIAMPDNTGSNSGTEGNTGGGGWQPARGWFGTFVGWLGELFSDGKSNAAEDVKNSVNNRVEKNRSENRKVPYFIHKK